VKSCYPKAEECPADFQFRLFTHGSRFLAALFQGGRS
jgi:hypothetical protein